MMSTCSISWLRLHSSPQFSCRHHHDADVIHHNQQPAVCGQADTSATSLRLDLQPHVPTQALKPKKKNRRQGHGLLVDMETQVSSNIIKQGLGHFKDTLRCSLAMDFAPSYQRQSNFKAPGRKVGKVLTDDFKGAAQVRALDQLVWDWDKVDNQEQEREKMDQVSIDESGVNSRREMRDTSDTFLSVPQAESSQVSMDFDQGMDQQPLSMDVDQGRDQQLNPIPEEVVVNTSTSRVNGGGLNEEQIPDLHITENLDGQGVPQTDQEVPLPPAFHNQNIVVRNIQDSDAETEQVPANPSLLEDPVSCTLGDNLYHDASPSPLGFPPATRVMIEMRLSGLLKEKE